MEQNQAFSILLRSLGYDLYAIGGRVLEGGKSVRGFEHMAIILTLDGIEYLVDVGYGSNCLTAPLPIFNGEVIEEPIKGVIPEEHRVRQQEIPGAGKKGHKIWALQVRRSPQTDWETQYIFEKDFEFFGQDYEMYIPGISFNVRMNVSTSKDPNSIFLNLIVCANVMYNDLEAVSRMILVNLELKKREKGETKVLEMFDTEKQRIAALEREFNITLTSEEREGIKERPLAVNKFDKHTKQTVF
jgi:arylamine N-acetyltransferase